MGRKTPEATIIVVHYGSTELTENTVKSLLPLLDTMTITVVSNDVEAPSEFPVPWLCPGDNLGYLGAARFFLDQQNSNSDTDQPTVVVLNNDLLHEVYGHSLPSAVRAMVRSLDDPSVGVAGPTLVDVSPAGPRLLPALRFPRFAKRPREGATGSPNEVDWVAGAAVAIAGRLAPRVIDDSYFLGGEDLDLSYRCWLAKKRVVRLPNLVGHHTSSSIGSGSWAYLGSRGVARFLRQHRLHTALMFFAITRLPRAFKDLCEAAGTLATSGTWPRHKATARLVGTYDGVTNHGPRTERFVRRDWTSVPRHRQPLESTSIAASPNRADPGLPRVCLLALGRYSGASPFTLQLARRLVEKADLSLVVGREAANLRDWRVFAAETRIDLEEVSVYNSFLGAFLGLLTGIRIRKIRVSIRRQKPDIVVVYMNHLWTSRLLSASKATSVLFVHDPIPHPGIADRLHYISGRSSARKSSRVVVHTKSFLPVMARDWCISEDRLSFIPLGALSEFSSATPNVPPTQQDMYDVLCFGRMKGYKGVNVLLNAARILLTEHSQIRIRIVGLGLSSTMLSEASALPNVTIENRWVADSEIPALFTSAKIVALPYTSATQSGVVSIAATFKKAVVASDVGGIAEQLDSGRLGFLVPPNDPAALAKALVELLGDPSRQETFGELLHTTFEQRRTWEAVAQHILDIAPTRTPL